MAQTKTGYVLTSDGIVHDTFRIYDPTFVDEIYETIPDLYVGQLQRRRNKINKLRDQMDQLEEEINQLTDEYIDYLTENQE